MSDRPIKEVMSQVRVIIEADEMFLNAAAKMKEYEVRHLPVTRNGKLIGVVSERDIGLTSDLGGRVPDLTEVLVADICVSNPYTVSPDANLSDVLMNMAEKKVGSTIIVEGDKPVGIFTVTDACIHYAESLRA